MDGLTRYKVSFRIGDDNLNPAELTEILKINPDKAHRKGDPHTSTSKKGKIIHYSPFRTGVWILNSREDEYVTLEQHLKSLLTLLYPLKDLLAEFTCRGYKMDIFCGAFVREVHQPGFDISSDMLTQLGELNISLGVCIYPY